MGEAQRGSDWKASQTGQAHRESEPHTPPHEKDKHYQLPVSLAANRALFLS